MSFFDFFFPEQAQAHHLRRIASGMQSQSRRRRRERVRHGAMQDKLEAIEFRLDELERDNTVLGLVSMALFKKLCDTTDLSLVEFQNILKEVDKLDGVEDGRIDMAELRRVFGIEEPVPPGARDKAGAPLCRDCGRPILKSRKRCAYCGGEPA
jgi:hypothetical protein